MRRNAAPVQPSPSLHGAESPATLSAVTPSDHERILEHAARDAYRNAFRRYDDMKNTYWADICTEALERLERH